MAEAPKEVTVEQYVQMNQQELNNTVAEFHQHRQAMEVALTKLANMNVGLMTNLQALTKAPAEKAVGANHEEILPLSEAGDEFNINSHTEQ